jgi:hypothetical protein
VPQAHAQRNEHVLRLLRLGDRSASNSVPVAGESAEVIESLLVDAIPSDPHIPSYPDVGEVLTALKELHSKREERASRRRQGKAVSTSEAFRMTRAIVLAADQQEYYSDNGEDDAEYQHSWNGDLGSSMAKSACSASHEHDEDSQPEVDIDRPIIVTGWNNHKVFKQTKKVGPIPIHRAWPCRHWDTSSDRLEHTTAGKRSRTTSRCRNGSSQPKRTRLLSTEADTAGDASSVSTEHDGSPRPVPLRALLLHDFEDEVGDGDYVYQSASEDFESDLESDDSVRDAESDNECTKVSRATCQVPRQPVAMLRSTVRTRAQCKATIVSQEENLNIGVRLTRNMHVPSFYALL